MSGNGANGRREDSPRRRNGLVIGGFLGALAMSLAAGPSIAEEPGSQADELTELPLEELLQVDVVSAASRYSQSVSSGRRAEDGVSFGVILDAQMPGMDGFEVATALRAEDTLDRTALVLATSCPGAGDPGRARSAGIQSTLPKPFVVSDLHRAIRRALDFSGAKSYADRRSHPGPIEAVEGGLRVLVA